MVQGIVIVMVMAGVTENAGVNMTAIKAHFEVIGRWGNIQLKQ